MLSIVSESANKGKLFKNVKRSYDIDMKRNNSTGMGAGTNGTNGNYMSYTEGLFADQEDILNVLMLTFSPSGAANNKLVNS